ncbi:thioesterase II family protein [Streptomyces sp. NPDC008238]
MSKEGSSHARAVADVALDDVVLIRIQQPAVPSRYRLVCFPDLPDAGNSSVCYLAMSELLLPTVELLIVQYPLPAAAEAGPAGNCPGLADKIYDAVRDWTDRPLALFGHGLGAELAYGVAQRLERETGTVPLTLFVSGRPGPGHRGFLGPPALRCRVVALTGDHNPQAPLPGVRAWRRCTAGRFDLEVFPGAPGYLDSHRREVVNLVHDQLISLHGPEPDRTAPKQGP